MNKYHAFLEITENLNNKRIKANCITLVKAAQNYYSYLMWYEKLISVDSTFNKYKVKGKDAITILDNYIILMCYEYVYKDIHAGTETAKYTFNTFLNEYVYSKQWRNNKNYLIFEEHPSLDYIKYKKLIIRALSKYRRLKKVTDFAGSFAKTRHINLEKAVNVYIDNPYLKVIDEETAFNSIFSEKLVEEFIQLSKGNETFMDLYIAPIRSVLSSDEGRNNAKDDYFNMKIDKSFNFLVSSCDERIKKYQTTIKNITVLNKWFLRIEKNI